MSSWPVASAYLAACRAELTALKPGNVHRYSAGQGMTVATFLAAAAASATPLAAAGASVGARVKSAIQVSLVAAGCNANLGIVLLAAPLAAAAERAGIIGLKAALRQVLAELTEVDAANVFAAIALASPGGLGQRAVADVRALPPMGLLAAMGLAQRRDLIARQYANGFADIFGFALHRLAVARTRGWTEEWVIAALYLDLLARFPDTHVCRKHGLAAACALRCEAHSFAAALAAAERPHDCRPALMAFDARLKAQGINPGTSADLTVATLFAEKLADLR